MKIQDYGLRIVKVSNGFLTKESWDEVEIINNKEEESYKSKTTFYSDENEVMTAVTLLLPKLTE